MSRAWVAPVAAGIVAFLLSGLFTTTGIWSIFDEYTHFDYVVKVGKDLTIPPVNDLLGDEAMRTAVCGAAPGFEAITELCTAENLPPQVAPYAGASTATVYLPPYYVLTGIGARGIVALPGDIDWLQASRLMGSLYLAVTAMLVVGVARRLGAKPVLAFSAALIAICMPMVLLQFSTVNNDSLTVLLCIASVYAFLRLHDHRRLFRWGVSYGIALMAFMTKETGGLGILAVTILAVNEARISNRRGLIAMALGMGALTAAIPLAFRRTAYPELVGLLPDNGLQNAAIDALQGTPPINLVFANALNQIPTALQVPASVLGGAWFSVGAMVVLLLGFGLCLALIVRSQRSDWENPQTLLAATILCYPPLFIAGFLIGLRFSSMPLFFQPRYLLPVMVLSIPVAVSWVRPAWTRALLPAGALLAGATAVSLLAADN